MIRKLPSGKYRLFSRKKDPLRAIRAKGGRSDGGARERPRLLGVITDRDLVVRAMAREVRPSEVRVGTGQAGVSPAV
jgi:hypothetical protein